MTTQYSNEANQALDGKSIEHGAPLAAAAPFPEENASDPANVFEGNFDRFDGLHVEGWVRERGEDSPVQVEVLSDGLPVATGLADLQRNDLRAARIGSGRHGFRIALPAALCDGEAHEIAVVTESGRYLLPPGPRLFEQSASMRGGVDGLDGVFVTGWVSRPSVAEPLEGELEVELHVDGRLVAFGEADERRGDEMRFRLRLTPDVLDGLPHVMTVTVKAPFFLVGQIAEITPAQLTSDDALQRYAGAFLNASLLGAASYRYESLRQQLAAFASAAPESGAGGPSSRLRQLSVAHEQLVRGFGSEALGNTALPNLEFSPVATPRVSIVIPVHNKLRVTYHCLASLLLAPNKATFEVIIVDDGSSDGTLELPDLVSGVTYIRHEVAEGFVRSCNDGGARARGHYVLMLNNDTEVTPGWLDELVGSIENFEGVGLVGAKLLYPDGHLQEAGGIVWNNGDPWNYGRGANARDPRYNYARQVDYLSGACVMLTKSLWDKIGGFDMHFAPAYFEDTDLAFRVREQGLKTVYVPQCQVIHFEGVSSGTSTASGMKRFQEINRPKFKSRWSQAVRNNGNVGKDVERNKDRNVRFRALVLDYATPQPDRDAGSYAAVQEIRLLQSLGMKVTFIPDNLAYLGSYTEDLQRTGVECVYAPFVLSVNELLEQRGGEFDIVYVTRYAIAQRHIEAIRRFAPQAKIVLNNADLHFLRELRTAIAFKEEGSLARALKTRDDELAVMRKVDLVLSYNEVEHVVILSHNLDSTRVARCPWVVDIPKQVPAFSGRRDIAFLGSFSHHPNREAVEYFIRTVMPLLRERLPGTVLRVYGSNISPEMLKLAADDIVFEGWVPHVADVYDRCRVFIAPLLTGAGIKGKVIGALAHGVPCVLSSVAAEGTGLRDGLEVLVADAPQAWVDAVVKPYSDEATWEKMSKAARAYARQEFSFAKGRKWMQIAMEMVDIFAPADNNGLTLQQYR
jgi:GT2 family glycosyltransferase/glycosyltransferase involved in cell wall biosynthesis